MLVGTAAVFGPRPAAGQVVAGYVRDGTTGQPVEGAFVQLLSARGAGASAAASAPRATASDSVLAAVLSDSAGFYALRAPAAGMYSVRVERIGYATTTTGPVRVAAGGSAAGHVALLPEAFVLPRLEVRAKQACVMRPAEGEAIFGLWQAARRALSVAAWTEREAGLFFESQTYTRRLDADGRTVLGEQVHTTWDRGRPPFTGLSTDSLLRNGFIEPGRHGDYVFYGPDPSVILSDTFLDTHCFRLTTSPEAGDVGLAFEPGRGATWYNVEGVLWLERTTGALDSITFAFTNMPRRLMVPATGAMDFRRLPTGAWIIRTWRIRVPIAGQMTPAGTMVGGYKETGGRVEGVYNRSGERTTLTRSATLVGVVRDTVGGGAAGTPPAGARVILLGTGRTAETDALGRFRFPPLLPGRYLVAFSTPSLDSLGWRATAVPVTLAAGGTDTLRLVAPSAAELATLRRQRSLAVVAGLVLDVASGKPVVDATVRLSGVAGEQVTDSAGGFRFDGVPPGDYTITVQHIAYGMTTDTLVLRPGSQVSVRFNVQPGVIGLKPLVVTGNKTDLSRYLGGFYERKTQALGGVFLAPEYVNEHRGSQLTDLLRTVPGVQVVTGGAGSRGFVVFRRQPRVTGQSCTPLLYVDGHRLDYGDDMNVVPAEDIAAVEVYEGASYIPPQFMDAGSSCGVVAIWTRRGQAPPPASDTIPRP
jgi:Carboxypeptidase regulatory-like domain/TonB-dependent Receptor Plug Domain